MKQIRRMAGRSRLRIGERLSSAALADYLAQLAESHNSPETGNPLLADALRSLAKSVRQKSISTQVRGLAKSAKPSAPDKRKKTQAGNSLSSIIEARPDRRPQPLSHLTESEIREFVNDESKTKEDLLRLASERFSMPLSQLRRSKISEIKQTILSAWLHESSMEIISEEAQREGKARSS